MKLQKSQEYAKVFAILNMKIQWKRLIIYRPRHEKLNKKTQIKSGYLRHKKMNSNEPAHDVNDGHFLSYGVSTPNFCSHDVFF